MAGNSQMDAGSENQAPLEPPAPNDAPTMAMPAVGEPVGDQGSHGGEATVKKSHKGLWVTLWVVLGLVAVLAIADFCIGQFYLKSRAPLGTSFAGQPVAGKTETEVRALVQKKADDTRIAVSGDGKTASLTYSEIGVSPDVDATVSAVMDAKGSNPFAKANIFGSQNIGLVASMNTSKLQTAATRALVASDAAVKEPTVTYDSSNKSFIVNPGREGKSVKTSTVADAVKKSLTTSATTVSVPVTISSVDPAISQDAAAKAAGDANQRLRNTYVVSNGAQRKFYIPKDAIASWMKVTGNAENGTMSLTVDQKAAAEYLNKELVEQLTQKKQDETILVTPTGQKLLTETAGYNGVTVTNVTNAVNQVIAGVQNNTSVSATVETKIDQFTTQKKQVPSNFDVPNGDPWLKIDLSTQQVFAYRGTTLVNTFPVSTGKNVDGRQTRDGTFYVYLKPAVQTMRGADYVTPNVRWISYFDGGRAFHAAPWNLSGIASGTPKSHGCVNMTPADAKWVYDFAPIGTKVVVVGTTPNGAVR